MEHLTTKLQAYGKSHVYPYHMPGHKRRPFGMLGEELCGIDITEIEGFDNLHQPQGILQQLQRQAARLYGADESFYLVNGSTAGILSAVSAALPAGGHILMARNCHRSAYHGAYLRNLTVSYLMPPALAEYDICDAVTPRQIREALDGEPDIGAVLVVSPTYEGRIADIRRIAEAVHERNLPLIVDEAHGAHLGIMGGTVPNSCQAGADLVIHSVHKTLPSLTQTALLHVNGPRVPRDRLKRFLQIYQSSSPSYLLMASIDNALTYVEQEGGERFAAFLRQYGRMMETLSACKRLRILPWETEVQDIGKLVISVKHADMTGRELYNRLLTQYGLQVEMAAKSYVLAMFTINDGPEAYERMMAALLEIDGQLASSGEPCPLADAGKEGSPWDLPVCRIPLAQAWDMDTEERELARCEGRTAGEFVCLYPPGIPILAPGEQMTRRLCGEIRQWVQDGFTVQGVEEKEGGIFIKVIRETKGTVRREETGKTPESH